MRDRIKQSAEKNLRSMNSEIIQLILKGEGQSNEPRVERQ